MSDKTNMISSIRGLVKKDGFAIVDTDMFNQLQKEWILRCPDSELVSDLQAEVKELKDEPIVRRLAAWSRKFPQSTIHSSSIQKESDDEIKAIEELAKGVIIPPGDKG